MQAILEMFHGALLKKRHFDESGRPGFRRQRRAAGGEDDDVATTTTAPPPGPAAGGVMPPPSARPHPPLPAAPAPAPAQPGGPSTSSGRPQVPASAAAQSPNAQMITLLPAPAPSSSSAPAILIPPVRLAPLQLATSSTALQPAPGLCQTFAPPPGPRPTSALAPTTTRSLPLVCPPFHLLCSTCIFVLYNERRKSIYDCMLACLLVFCVLPQTAAPAVTAAVSGEPGGSWSLPEVLTFANHGHQPCITV
jgi:hypothetical protein